MKSRYITHVISPGDTIQAIAMLYGVDWTKLVVINGLNYPYIDSTVGSTAYANTDEVAKVGDRLVIPTKGLLIPSKTNSSMTEMEKYTFGCDLDLFAGAMMNNGTANVENLGVLHANEDGDVLLAEGINNLRQQLIIRLGTPKGSLMMHPEWGSDLLQYIGSKLTMERLIKIKLAVQECVLGDFRVLGISDMRATFKSAAKLDTGLNTSDNATKGLFIDFIVHPIDPYSVFRLGKTFTK